MGNRRNSAMMRRSSTPPSSGGAAVDPIVALSPVALWRSDYGITEVSSAVSVWSDMISERTLTQGVAGNRPGYTASNANLNGLPSLNWADSGDRLNSSEAASAWKFLHDGVTGATVYIALYHATSNNYDSLFSTRGATSPGVELNIATDRARARNHNGTTLTNIDATGYTVGMRWIAARYTQVSGGTCRVSTSQSVTASWSTSGTFTPSAADPSQTLGVKIGVNGTGTPVNIGEIIVFDRVLDDTDHATVVGAIESRYAM